MKSKTTKEKEKLMVFNNLLEMFVSRTAGTPSSITSTILSQLTRRTRKGFEEHEKRALQGVEQESQIGSS